MSTSASNTYDRAHSSSDQMIDHYDQAWALGYETGRQDAAKAIEQLQIMTLLVVNRFDAIAVARGDLPRVARTSVEE